MFFFNYQLSKQLGLRMSNYNDNKNIYPTMYHTLPKKINRNSKKSPVEYDEIDIICIRPAVNRNISPIGRNTEPSQAQIFSERKPERN